MRLEPLAGFDAVRDEWEDLALRSENVFSTWDWAEIWWRHFGGGRSLRLVGCRRPDGRLAAILPLYRHAGRPLRVFRFLGGGPGDELGPVCDPVDVPEVARALGRLTELPGFRADLLLAERLPGSVRWSTLTGARPLQRESSPVLRIDGSDFDSILAARSANFRQQVRRRERKLAREHSLRYRLSSDPAELDADMGLLVELHQARWGDRGSGAFEPAREAFHREFAARALECGWLRLWFAEIDGRAVAAWHGFRYAGVESFYQAGRDPAWDAQNVGFILLAHTIREAAEDGMREYRLLRGDEPYKARFADDDPGLETLALGWTPAGRAAAGLAGIATRRPRARRLLAAASRI